MLSLKYYGTFFNKYLHVYINFQNEGILLIIQTCLLLKVTGFISQKAKLNNSPSNMELTDFDQDKDCKFLKEQNQLLVVLNIAFGSVKSLDQLGQLIIGRDSLHYQLYKRYQQNKDIFYRVKRDMIEQRDQDTIKEGDQQSTIQDLLKTIKKYNLSQLQLYFQQYQLSLRKAFFTPKILDMVMSHCRFITKIVLISTTTNYSIQKLASSFQFLKILSLRRYCIDSEGVIKLAKNKFKYLKTLEINYNPIKNAGLKYLMRAQWPCLQTLGLFQCDFTEDSLKYFKKHCFTKLAFLDLARNSLYRSCIKKVVQVNCEYIRLPVQSKILSLQEQQNRVALHFKQIYHNIIIKMKGMKIPKSTASIHSVKELFDQNIQLQPDKI